MKSNEELREEVVKILSERGEPHATEIFDDKVLVYLENGTFEARRDENNEVMLKAVGSIFPKRR